MRITEDEGRSTDAIFYFIPCFSQLHAACRQVGVGETLALPFGDTVHDEQTVDVLKRVQKLAP